MTDLLQAQLSAPLLWITMTRSAVNGRKARDYHVLGADGAVLLTARAFNWGRDLRIWNHDSRPGDDQPHQLLLRRRRMFPITGNVDILDAGSVRIGEVRRNGAFRSVADGPTGRFRDARSARSRAAESVFITLMEAALGGEGDSEVSGPRSFVCHVADKPAGVLVSERLPFLTGPPAEPGRVTRALQRVLPRRLGERLLRARPQRGWKLAWTDAAPRIDPRVTIAAALFMVELSYWR